jgi:hypothetical protein
MTTYVICPFTRRQSQSLVPVGRASCRRHDPHLLIPSQRPCKMPWWLERAKSVYPFTMDRQKPRKCIIIILNESV